MGMCVLQDKPFDPAALLLKMITGKEVIYNGECGRWETIQVPVVDVEPREEEQEIGR